MSDDIRRHCDELDALIDQFRELGGDPRDFLTKPLVLFELEVPAVGQAGIKPLPDYVELCAALRNGVADLQKRARSRRNSPVNTPRRGKRS